MSGFMSGFREGLSEPSGPGSYEVAGVRVTCGHCGGTKFDEGQALLNTPGLTFLSLDWANKEAELLVCVRCGHVEWFLQQPRRIKASPG